MEPITQYRMLGKSHVSVYYPFIANVLCWLFARPAPCTISPQCGVYTRKRPIVGAPALNVNTLSVGRFLACCLSCLLPLLPPASPASCLSCLSVLLPGDVIVVIGGSLAAERGAAGGSYGSNHSRLLGAPHWSPQLWRVQLEPVQQRYGSQQRDRLARLKWLVLLLKLYLSLNISNHLILPITPEQGFSLRIFNSISIKQKKIYNKV